MKTQSDVLTSLQSLQKNVYSPKGIIKKCIEKYSNPCEEQEYENYFASNGIEQNLNAFIEVHSFIKNIKYPLVQKLFVTILGQNLTHEKWQKKIQFLKLVAVDKFVELLNIYYELRDYKPAFLFSTGCVKIGINKRLKDIENKLSGDSLDISVFEYYSRLETFLVLCSDFSVWEEKMVSLQPYVSRLQFTGLPGTEYSSALSIALSKIPADLNPNDLEKFKKHLEAENKLIPTYDLYVKITALSSNHPKVKDALKDIQERARKSIENLSVSSDCTSINKTLNALLIIGMKCANEPIPPVDATPKVSSSTAPAPVAPNFEPTPASVEPQLGASPQPQFNASAPETLFKKSANKSEEEKKSLKGSPELRGVDNYISAKEVDDMIVLLMKNIKEKAHGRKTSGLSSKKYYLLEQKLEEIRKLPPKQRIEKKTLTAIEEICEIKRHPWNFWKEPHSVKEYNDYIKDLTVKPKN